MVALGLRAVVPDGRVVDDGDLVDVGVLTLGSDKVEAGKEASAISKGLARMSKVGLSQGVVGSSEVPLNSVTDLSLNDFRVEVKSTASNNDGMGHTSEESTGRKHVALSRSGNSRHAGDGSGQDGEDAGSVHFEVCGVKRRCGEEIVVSN